MSTFRLLALVDDAPPVFKQGPFENRDLFAGAVAILARSPEDLDKLPAHAAEKVEGLFITQDGRSPARRIGRSLWHLAVRPEDVPKLGSIIAPLYPLITALGQASDDRDLYAMQLARARRDLESRRLDYHEATHRLHKRVEQAEEMSLVLKRQMDELRTSERRYRALFEHAFDMITLHDDKGGVLAANSRAAARLGYTKQELLSLRMSTLHDPIALERLREQLQAMKTNATAMFESFYVRKSKQSIPVEIAAHRFLLDGRPAILMVARDISERRAAEEMAAEIAERERVIFGRELHDSIGQRLSASVYMGRRIQRRLEARGIAEAADVEEMVAELGKATTEVRELARSLARPVTLDKGLHEALEELVRLSGECFDIECSLDYELKGDPVEPTAAAHIYWIVQESIRNAVLHAQTRKVRVELQRSQTGVELIVENDGRPFAGKESRHRGAGLAIMTERARLAGGSFDIRSTDEGTTRVACQFPLVAGAA